MFHQPFDPFMHSELPDVMLLQREEEYDNDWVCGDYDEDDEETEDEEE